MRKCNLRHPYWVCFLLHSIAFPFLAIGGEVLSVEETIASAYLPIVPDGVRQHANPEARLPIVQMFEEAVGSGRDPSSSVLALMGFLGAPEDVARLESYVKAMEGQSRPQAGLSNAMTALGRMAYRGIAPAKEVLSSMAEKEYWKSLGVRTMPDWLYEKYPDLITANAVYARYLLGAANRTSLPSQEEMLHELYPAHTSDEEARKRFIYQIAIARKGAESMAKSQERKAEFRIDAKTRSELKWAYDRFHLGKVPVEAEESKPATPVRTPESAVEMMSQVIRPDAAVPEEAKAFYAELAKEAIAAFQSFFAERVEADDYDALRGRILDDGKPQVPRLVEKYWPEIRQELEDTQGPVFRALRSGGLAPDAGQYTAGQAEDGSYIVTMPIPNSGALVDEHWKATGQEAQVLAEGFAISDSLELVLVMRKIEGVWYWNPFGW